MAKDSDWNRIGLSRVWKIGSPAVAVLGFSMILVASLAVFVRAQGSNKEPEVPKSKLSYLVARRELADPFFERSVVLMLPSEDMPLVVGLIVNKPTQVPLSKLYPDSRILKDSKATAYFGGPVDIESPTLLFRSAKPPNHALLLFGDAYLTFDPDLISSLLKNPQQKGAVRLILGRAQWGPEQLENEMRREAWYRVEAEGDFVFDADTEHVWRRLFDRAQPRLDIRNLLTDPRLPNAI